MADTITLDVEVRSVEGKKVKRLRQQGILPAVIYGKSFEAISLQINERAFQNVYKQAGRSRLIEVNIPGKGKQAAFVHMLQRHPITRAILHADLRAVDLKIELTVEVRVITTGESPIVERGDAILLHVTPSVQVHALPANIPQQLEVDISGLESVDQSIFLRDLAESSTYKVLGDPDTVLIALTPARTAEEEATTTEEVPAEPELIRKPRESDDEE
jgi:large subunit ribosomal protein L25